MGQVGDQGEGLFFLRLPIDEKEYGREMLNVKFIWETVWATTRLKNLKLQWRHKKTLWLFSLWVNIFMQTLNLFKLKILDSLLLDKKSLMFAVSAPEDLILKLQNIQMPANRRCRMSAKKTRPARQRRLQWWN